MKQKFFQSLLSNAQRRIRLILELMDDRPYVFLGLIVVLALVINLASLVSRPPTTELGQPQVGQSYRWWPLILNVINGRGYLLCIRSYFPFCGPGNEVTASLEPVPVFFFGGIALLTGESLLAAALAEVAVNIVLLLTTFWLARRFVSSRWALAASLVWATFIPALKLVSQISGDLLGACFLALAVLFFLRARDSHRWRDWIFSGLLLGLAIQSRSALLVVLPGLLLGLLVEAWLDKTNRWPQVWKNLRFGAVLAGLVCLTLLPWFVRNIVTFGNPVVGTSLTGYVIYRQNYMLDTDDYLRIVGSEEARQAIKALVAQRADLSPTLNEIQMDGVYRDEAIRLILAYPGRYVLVSLYRFLPLWFNWRVNEAYGDQTSLLSYVIMLEQALLLGLGLFGMWKTARQSWPLWLTIMIVSAAYMAVNGQIRYLVPLMPFVITLSMVGLRHLFARSVVS